jgi:hypothetical protein
MPGHGQQSELHLTQMASRRFSALLLWLFSGALCRTHDHPALIPYPRQVEWNYGNFDCSRYEIQTPPEAAFAAQELQRIPRLPEQRSARAAAKIEFRIGQAVSATEGGSAEAYAIEVASTGVAITAPKAASLFNAVQTVRQLLVGTTGCRDSRGCPQRIYGQRGYVLPAYWLGRGAGAQSAVHGSRRRSGSQTRPAGACLTGKSTVPADRHANVELWPPDSIRFPGMPFVDSRNNYINRVDLFLAPPP